MSEFDKWYSENGTWNNMIDEPVWNDMEKLYSYWKQSEQENAKLKDLLKDATEIIEGCLIVKEYIYSDATNLFMQKIKEKSE